MKRQFHLLLVFFLLVGCKKDTQQEVTKFEFEAASYFPSPVYTFGENELRRSRFDLGKDLFYSKDLSSDNTISCASCHAQTHGFADHNVALSAGVDGQLGTRNAPPIFNMAWQPHFMWDGGVNHLEIFSLAPITNPVEMNLPMDALIDKLNESEVWKEKFKVAYNVNEINDHVLFKALAQFMALIISDNAKYDAVRRGDKQFTSIESQGYSLFQQKCANCHTEPLFTDYSFRNNGLDSQFTDEGRAKITLQTEDLGKFKVPTLRNIAVTYPYMHDGRFFTLNEVLDHYASGIQHSETLDTSLENGISLTSNEKSALIAFLNTLTDYEMMNDPFFAEP